MPPPNPADLQNAANRLLGPITLITDHSWPSTSALVWRIRTRDGHELIIKHNSDELCFQREYHAFAHWTPALGSGAPQLVAHDKDTRTLVLTPVPGVPLQQLRLDPSTERNLYQRAGHLLRLLHQAQPAEPLPEFVATRTAYVQDLLDSNGSLLTAEERELAETAMQHMAGLPIMNGRPSHLDCTPRNLLADTATGSVHLIDFETARLDIEGRDFNRLASRIFTYRPDLEESFFTGYGRQPTNDEKTVMLICGAVDAVSALIYALSNNNAGFAAEARATLRRQAKHLSPAPSASLSIMHGHGDGRIAEMTGLTRWS